MKFNQYKKIASKYNVAITRDTLNCSKNHGGCAGRHIYLGKFDKENIEEVAFFYELGHALSDEMVYKNRGSSMSTLSSEGTAWELGLGLAHEHGFDWDYDSPELTWARRQLASYIPKAEIH